MGRWWRLIAVVGVVALVGSACADDGDSADDADEETDETEEVTEGPPVSGEPFTIGVIYTAGVSGIDLPDLVAGAEAAAEYINTELGGIDGRPVEILACNDDGDVAENVACAQEFVDAGVLAVTGLNPLWGDNGLPITTEAQIPTVTLPVTFPEFIGEASYPFLGASPSQFPALAKYFAEELGIESASVIYADLEAGQLAANALLADFLKERGVEDVTLVPEAVGAADFTSALVKANEGDPDAIFVLFAAEDCARIFQAAQQTGVTATLAAPGSCGDEAVLEDAGDAAEGVYIGGDTTWVVPDDEETEIFRDRLMRYQDFEPTSQASATFSQVMTLWDIGNRIGADALTAPALLDTLATIEGQHVFMGPELSASNAVELAGVETNVYAPESRILLVEDGEVVDVDGWVNGHED